MSLTLSWNPTFTLTEYKVVLDSADRLSVDIPGLIASMTNEPKLKGLVLHQIHLRPNPGYYNKVELTLNSTFKNCIFRNYVPIIKDVVLKHIFILTKESFLDLETLADAAMLSVPLPKKICSI